MRTFAAVVAFAATANAELTEIQQLACDTYKGINAEDTTSDAYKAVCDEATVNAALNAGVCDAYKAANADDTTSDAYKAACDAASTLYMGAAMVAAAAALAF